MYVCVCVCVCVCACNFYWSTINKIIIINHLIDQDMVRESIGKMKNGRAAWKLGLISEILKALGETGEASVIMYH